MSFRPFADDATTLTTAGVTIENGTDRVVVPSFEVTRDREGLDRVRGLIAALDGIARVLEADPRLPGSVGPEAVERPVELPNPFARKG